ncbi:hypothetical protein [uncultured Bacteroides sp.]|uniref:hypothetical protein n=1 Tax=uncultured Bacteroides sp. TaxID=162156 RepID=UPI002AABEAE4|nr:hypothetical protein [uncultured Bacteroides sp.]
MNNILKNWDFSRIIKLIAGIGISIYAITEKEYSFLFLAGFLFLQAILNISCCGAGGCSSSTNNSQKEVFKGEIKQYKPEK